MTLTHPETRWDDGVVYFGDALIDRELYLPCDWIEDRDRCRAAGIPETVRFQTKPELAVQMMERIWKAAVPISWVVADTVYGGNLDLRTWLETHQYSSVLAVACNEPIGILTPDGRRRRVEVCEVEALLLREEQWQCLSMSQGSKGPRLFDWAAVPILHRWEDDGRHWLLLRRTLSDPREVAYFFVFAPLGTTLSEMVQAIGARWHIERNAHAPNAFFHLLLCLAERHCASTGWSILRTASQAHYGNEKDEIQQAKKPDSITLSSSSLLI